MHASRVASTTHYVLIELDLAEDYGEDRFVAVGRAADGVADSVVFTERGERVRIISARKANNHERRAYDRSYGG